MQNRQTRNEARGKNWSGKWVAPGLLRVHRARRWVARGRGHRTTEGTTENALISEACSPEAPAKYMRKKGGSTFLPRTKGMRDIQRHFERAGWQKNWEKCSSSGLIPCTRRSQHSEGPPLAKGATYSPFGITCSWEILYQDLLNSRMYQGHINFNSIYMLYVSRRSGSSCLNWNQL